MKTIFMAGSASARGGAIDAIKTGHDDVGEQQVERAVLQRLPCGSPSP